MPDLNRERLDIYKRYNDFIFEMIKELISKTEEWIRRDWSALEKDFEKAIGQDISDTDILKMEQEKILEQSKLGHVFPRILRYSILVFLFGQFEKRISILCEAYQKKYDTISLNELKGSVINRLNVFFKKVIQIEVPTQLPPDGNLSIVSKIRNVIVHNNGIAEDEDLKRKIRLLSEEKIPHIWIDPNNGRIDIWDDFLLWVIDEMKSCLNDICNQISEKILA